MRYSSAIKKRAWIKRHKKNFVQIDKYLDDRFTIIRDKFWDGQETPTFLLFCLSLCGFIDILQCFFVSLGILVTGKNEDEGCNDMLRLLFSFATFNYLNLKQTDIPDIKVFVSPAKIPTDSIHLFDLTLKEFYEILDEAKAKCGHDKRKDFIQKWEKANIVPDDDPLQQKANILAKAYIEACESREKAAGKKLTPEERKYLHEFTSSIFNAEKLREISPLTEKMYQDYRNKIPEAGKYETELYKSISKENAQIAIDLLASSGLAKDVKTAAGIEGKMLTAELNNKLEAIKSMPDKEKANPDDVYRTYKEILERRQFIQKTYKHFKKDKIKAFHECRIKYPGLHLEDITIHLEYPTENSEQALIETQNKLKIGGLEYCRDLKKRASKNSNINRIWTDFFKKMGCDKIFPLGRK